MKLTTGQKIGIAGVIVGLSAIGIYLKSQLSKIYNGNWKLAGVKNLNVALDKISFTVMFMLENKGDISVVVSEQNYNVFINGVPVSNINNKTNVKIVAKGFSVIPFDISISIRELLSVGLMNLGDFISNKEKIVIKTKGSLSIKAGIVSLKKYPFELEYTLAQILDAKKSKDVNNAT